MREEGDEVGPDLNNILLGYIIEPCSMVIYMASVAPDHTKQWKRSYRTMEEIIQNNGTVNNSKVNTKCKQINHILFECLLTITCITGAGL